MFVRMLFSVRENFVIGSIGFLMLPDMISAQFQLPSPLTLALAGLIFPSTFLGTNQIFPEQIISSRNQGSADMLDSLQGSAGKLGPAYSPPPSLQRPYTRPIVCVHHEPHPTTFVGMIGSKTYPVSTVIGSIRIRCSIKPARSHWKPN